MKFHYLLLLLLTLLLQSNTPTFAQGEALLELKSCFTEDPYEGLLSWGSSVHYCSWTGVTCSDGIQGQIVIAIDLSGLKLAGTISPAIGTNSLTTLQSISLAGNRLIGMLPSSLSHLSHLKYLNLSHNKLGGPIPGFLGSLPELVSLDLSFNNFSGPLPAMFAFQPTNCSIFRGNPYILSTICHGEPEHSGPFCIKWTLGKIIWIIFVLLTGGGSAVAACKHCRWSLQLRAGNEDFRARPSGDPTNDPTSANPSESTSSDSEVESEHEMT